MRILQLLPFAVLAYAKPGVLRRQENSTLTSSPAVSSAAAELVEQYFPSSVLPGLAIAIQSAAQSSSVTGNINSIVSSVLTAATPPPFLTDVPSQYQSGLSAIQQTLSSIRVDESLSVVRSDASVAYQSQLSAIDQTQSSIREAATALPTTSENVTLVSTITSMDSVYTTSLPATVVNGSTSVVTPTETMAEGGAATSGGESSGEPTSSSSGGLAAATKVPFAAAAAGALGLVGVVALL
ncbi:MAG: hypothetical protein Q9193_006472 [Seirophora villosa]